MIDEKAEDLGTHLLLSPWLESTHKDLKKSFLLLSHIQERK
jgi:hypothetical protein